MPSRPNPILPTTAEVSNSRVPVPDPTTLTTLQVNREILALREFLETLINGKVDVIVSRLNGMDKALELLQDINDRQPQFVDNKISNLQHLHEEKFDYIETRLDLLKDERAQLKETVVLRINAVEQRLEGQTGHVQEILTQSTTHVQELLTQSAIHVQELLTQSDKASQVAIDKLDAVINTRFDAANEFKQTILEREKSFITLQTFAEWQKGAQTYRDSMAARFESINKWMSEHQGAKIASKETQETSVAHLAVIVSAVSAIVTIAVSVIFKLL